MNNLNIDNAYVGSDQVEKIYLGADIVWTQEPGPDYRSMPLTFDILSSGTIMWKAYNSSNTKTIEYRINDGAWSSLTSSTAGTSFIVTTGDKVELRGGNTTYGTSSTYNTFCGTTAVFDVYGNIMSLIDSTNFVSITSFTNWHVFRYLFCNCTGLANSNKLILPVMTLSERCYERMFYGCINLVTAPELPATTLAATCYNCMFLNCTSLTTAPVLPATTLPSNSYNSMFGSCSALTAITCLATDISAGNCLTNWVGGVAANGTFTKHPNMTSWTSGPSGIPANWTVVDAVI